MNIKGKQVTVMGLGLHGGGAAVVKWLAKHGAKITVTDLKTKAELKNSLSQLKKYKINWVLGKHLEKDFNHADFIVKNPGVPSDSKYLKIARKNKILIENDASLFFKHCAGKIIGVTGTRGKSTTAILIHRLLPNSYLGGLPQMSMMDILEKVKKNNYAVLELSSWQLEILGEQDKSPDIAIVTNIFPDHLNRYNSMREYVKAKKNIYLHQNRDDTVVLNKDNSETRKIGRQVKSKRYWASKNYFAEENGCYIKDSSIYFRKQGQETKLANVKDIKISGEGNLENVLIALATASSIKINSLKFRAILRLFKGLPGRMETIGNFKGITYINDTTSTIPDATIIALKQISGKRTVLIAGGDFKNIPDSRYKELAKYIKQKCKVVVLFSGKGSQQIIKQLKPTNIVTEVKNMAEALSIAKSFAQPGDTILLSPACVSFNLFVNEFDRGDQFSNYVKQIK